MKVLLDQKESDVDDDALFNVFLQLHWMTTFLKAYEWMECDF